MSLSRQFAKNLAWATAGNWAREIINIAVFLALARLLGPHSYGVMGMVGISAAIGDALLIDGLSNFIARSKEFDHRHANAVFWIQASIGVLLALATLGVSPVLAALYHEPEVAQVMPVMAILPILYVLSSVQTAVLQRAMRFRPLTIRSFAAAALGGVVGLSLAASGAGVWSLILMGITQWTVTCIVLWTASDWRPSFDVQREDFREVIRFGGNAVGVKLLIILDQQLPRLVIASTLGAVSLGYFTIAWRMVEVLSLLTLNPIAQVTLPTLGSIQDDRPRLQAGIGSIVALAAAIALPCYLGLSAVAPELLPIISGHAWDGAIPLLQLFAVFGLGWTLLGTLDTAMLVTGHMLWRTQFTLFGTALLAGGLVFTSGYGLVAIAWTMVARELVTCVISVYALLHYRLGNGPDLLRRVAPFFAATGTMLVVVLTCQHWLKDQVDAPILLASSISIGVITYGAVLFAVARDRAMELLAVSLFRQKRKVLT